MTQHEVNIYTFYQFSASSILTSSEFNN